MKIYILLSVFILTASSLLAQERFELDEKTEKKIDEIISELTLTEKVGQTCQITLDALLARDESGKLLEPIQFDPDKFNEALCEYRIGSILNVSSHTLTLDEWNNILPKVNNAFLNEKINVPIIYGIDAIHGVNYTVRATLFPQEIGLAATWNDQLSYEFGEITAYEMRKTGLRWNFSPVLDLGRQPLWSRFFETLGEDPYLAGRLGENIIMGYQGSKYNFLDNYHVASCLKHFVGYSMPQTGRDRTPAWIPRKFMTELYIPPFKKSIDAGAMTLMINSGDLNGVPGHANKTLLTDLLKDKWGFKGFTVSDWEDFIMLETVHNVAADQSEAIAMAINAGVDMNMVPYYPQYKEYCEILTKCVENGDVSMERLEDAVRRILRVKMATGLYDKKSYKETDYPKFASEEFKNAALQSALESITLLKNQDDILPLKKSTKVLVAGPTGNDLTFINGAWTHTWQGVDASYNTKNCETIYSAIAKEVGAENCQFAQGATLYLEDGWETAKMAYRTGKEVVQLYVSDLKASIVPAGKRLRAYAKIDLEPNETRTVNFTINSDDLRFSDIDGNWIIENGLFQLEINGENLKFELN